MKITYQTNDSVFAPEFASLFSIVFPKAPKLDPEMTAEAIRRSINVVARDTGSQELVGCLRIVSDGYLMSSVADVLVHPMCDSKKVFVELMELAYRHSPSGLTFSCQSLDPECAKLLGWVAGPVSFFKRKPLRSAPLQ